MKVKTPAKVTGIPEARVAVSPVPGGAMTKDDCRQEALRAFVAGFHCGVDSSDGHLAPGLLAQKSFERWWNDEFVSRARTARKETP